jgi:hypothetical protein
MRVWVKFFKRGAAASSPHYPYCQRPEATKKEKERKRLPLSGTLDQRKMHRGLPF